MIVVFPTPVTVGSKVVPDTPFPEYVPPAGFPPVKLIVALLSQIGLIGVNVTEGIALTT